MFLKNLSCGLVRSSDISNIIELPSEKDKFAIVAESSTGETRYLLSDGLGSVRQAVDETGSVVAYNEFDPYGNPVQNGSSPYGFTGEWWQAEVGLLHLRARWYSVGTGTFLSRDPVESQLPYQYVNGSPTNRIDPSGLCTWGGDELCWRLYEQVLRRCPNCSYAVTSDGAMTRLVDLEEARLRAIIQGFANSDRMAARIAGRKAAEQFFRSDETYTPEPPSPNNSCDSSWMFNPWILVSHNSTPGIFKPYLSFSSGSGSLGALNGGPIKLLGR
ncbi:MAG: RHS repeat-associated core domain-containing protein, partial [Ketobacter sp.]|nr:RHS repeat-associated core domain-containing protein [Ketobacter sp.]